MLMVRVVLAASFQPKLSVIAGTLARASGDLTYFVAVLTVVSAKVLF